MEAIVRWFDGLLGITAVGWFLVFVVYVPVTIAVAVLASTRWREHRRRARVVALAVYAPLVAALAEAAYVDVRFKALCATAGSEIRRSVVVDGFYDAGTRSESWEQSLRSGDGYSFVEWKDKAGRTWRSERTDDGRVVRLPIASPTARYHWYREEFALPFGYLIERREESIVDSETGEVIARRLIGYRYHAFIDRIWTRYMDGTPQVCGARDIRSKTLIGTYGKGK